MRWLAVAAAGWLASCACGSEPDGAVAVDVRTDLVPGIEFQSVRVELFAGIEAAGEPEDVESEAALTSSDFFGGSRVAEFSGLRSGPRVLRVRLLDVGGSTVAERVRRLDVERGAITVLVVISRRCRGSDPSCEVPECTADADCAAPAACASARCVERTCLAEPIDGACAAGEYCDPGLGCRARPLDAGPTLDAGPPPDAGPALDAGPGLDAGTMPDVGPPPPDTGPPPSCFGDADCPAPYFGAWGECGWTGPCDPDAERARDVVTWACVAGGCMPTARSESEPCARATEGTPCGDGLWCNGDEVCSGGACVPGTERCVVTACTSGCDEDADACVQTTAICYYDPGTGVRMMGSCGRGLCCPCGLRDQCATVFGAPACRTARGCTDACYPP